MVQIRWDRRGMNEAFTSSAMTAAVHGVAEQIAARARSSAPIESGEYRDSIGVRDDEWSNGRASMARSFVVATARHSMLVEARTGNLKRALGGA